MGKRALGHERSRIVQEAARIICEESVSDYRQAKQKAAQRLGYGAQAALPSNADVQDAVIQYQRLFGGREYAERLQRLRRTALQAMRLLAEHRPRLVGAVASGATTEAHQVQLHCFADKPELIDLLLAAKGLPFDVDERRYRYGDGQTADIPLLSFIADDIGVQIAVFPERAIRNPPLSPVDGAPMKRLGLAEVEALAVESLELIGDS